MIKRSTFNYRNAIRSNIYDNAKLISIKNFREIFDSEHIDHIEDTLNTRAFVYPIRDQSLEQLYATDVHL